MIQRFYFIGANEAYLTIDHTNHTYNFYTKWEDHNKNEKYISLPLRSIKEILQEIKDAGYKESEYQI